MGRVVMYFMGKMRDRSVGIDGGAPANRKGGQVPFLDWYICLHSASGGSTTLYKVRDAF